MKLIKEVIELFDKQTPIPIATANKDAIPNLVYVSSIKVYGDETIIISDNKFFKTKLNLLENPEIAICLYDPQTNKSYQLKGSVSIYTDGEIYEYGVQWMESKRNLRKKQGKLLPKAIVLVHIREIYSKGKKLEYIDDVPTLIEENE